MSTGDIWIEVGVEPATVPFEGELPRKRGPDPYGVDLLLTNQGDLAIWPTGEMATVAGPDNCVQAVTLRVRTREGDLPIHPDYGSGLPDKIGTKNTQLTMIAAQAQADLRVMLTQDRRFLATTALEVLEYQPGHVRVGVTLQLALGDQLRIGDLLNPAGNIDQINVADVRLEELTLPDDVIGPLPDDQSWLDNLGFVAGDVTVAQDIVTDENLALIGDPRVDQDASLDPFPAPTLPPQEIGD